MRQNVKSLAPTLWIVIAAFIVAIFAVWGGSGRLGESRAADTIVTIGKEKISAQFYFQNLRQRLDSLQKEFKELDKKLIQQLNIPQQVLEQIIQQNLLFQTAQEMGLKASDDEMREKIMSYPVFQKDGKFIGFEDYKKILEWNRTSTSEFENMLKKEIMLDKDLKFFSNQVDPTLDIPAKALNLIISCKNIFPFQREPPFNKKYINSNSILFYSRRPELRIKSAFIV